MNLDSRHYESQQQQQQQQPKMNSTQNTTQHNTAQQIKRIDEKSIYFISCDAIDHLPIHSPRFI